jgi:hypothetical protein
MGIKTNVLALHRTKERQSLMKQIERDMTFMTAALEFGNVVLMMVGNLESKKELQSVSRPFTIEDGGQEYELEVRKKQ